MIVLVMGVAGSGKSTVGRLLAERLGWDFVDADDHHPASNVAKMASGLALTEADRAPWLAALARVIAAARAEEQSLVLACSALRRAYRDTLLGGRRDDCIIVHLEGSASLIAARMAGREHFMPPSALPAQIATLEVPDADEGALVLDVAEAPKVLVERIVAHLDARVEAGPAPG